MRGDARDVIAEIIGVERRHDEDVRRSLRIEVAEGDCVLAARDLVRRDLLADDLAEDAIIAHQTFGFISS